MLGNRAFGRNRCGVNLYEIAAAVPFHGFAGFARREVCFRIVRERAREIGEGLGLRHGNAAHRCECRNPAVKREANDEPAWRERTLHG
jgi:hypothetical protein